MSNEWAEHGQEPKDLSAVPGWVTLDLAVGFGVPLFKIRGLGLGVSEGPTSLQFQVSSTPQEVWLSCHTGDMEGSALCEVRIWGARRGLEQMCLTWSSWP